MKNSRNGIITEIDYKTKKIKCLYWVLFAFVAIACFISIAPLLWVIVSAGKDLQEFYSVPPTIIPKSFHISRFAEIWKQYNFKRYYINTLIIAGGSIFVSVFSNGLAGYVISKLKPKGIGIIFGLILITMMIPTSVAMATTYKNIIDFPILHVNLINNIIPILMMAGANSFLIIVFKSFFDGIHDSYLEAARLDGCGELKLFLTVIVPLSKPIIFTGIILSLTHAWGDFFWPFMILRKQELYTIIVQIYSIQDTMPTDTMLIMLTFAVLPLIILYLCFQKYFMQGLAGGGVKG